MNKTKMNKTEIGRLGETLALKYLLKAGYRLLSQNYRTVFGEIDLIVEKDNTIIFIEVKTRTSTNFGTPFDSITTSKRSRLIKLALHFCSCHHIFNHNLRFDVIGVLIFHDKYIIQHLDHAFNAGGIY